jgi:hypothetical protein
MMNFIKNNKIGVFILSVLILIWIHMIVYTEVVTVTGTVVEHNVVADKYGTAHYYTLVKYEDEIKSEQGIEFYVVPIGRKVMKTERRFK